MPHAQNPILKATLTIILVLSGFVLTGCGPGFGGSSTGNYSEPSQSDSSDHHSS